MLIGNYLIKAIQEAGARHVFGIQGDYVLHFYDQLHKSDLTLINTCDEQGAGFAADAYARMSGFGVVCVTYGVGGLKLANSTAQAFAERSPVLVISGAPGMSERSGDALLHHKVRSFETQRNVFREMTAATAALTDAQSAAAEIDRVIDAVMTTKRPGYLELPRDMVSRETDVPPKNTPKDKQDTSKVLNEALKEVLSMLRAAKRPIAVAGIDIHRFGLQRLFLDFLERSGLPFVTGILGKGVIAESHPQFVGVYAGAMSPDDVRNMVENADFILAAGLLITDLSTGMFTTGTLNPGKAVVACPDSLCVRHHIYPGLGMADVLKALCAKLSATPPKTKWTPKNAPAPFVPQTGCKVTMESLIACVNSLLDDHTSVIAEPGDPLFGGLDLFIQGASDFMSPAYYASLGFAVPGAVGVSLAAPDRRVIALVGGGSFQMTGMEISTAARCGLAPIVLVLNNGGYGTFRSMIDGPFNDLCPWQYADLPRVIGFGKGYTATNEEELWRALHAAKNNGDELAVIDVKLDKYDISPRLRRLTEQLKKRVIR